MTQPTRVGTTLYLLYALLCNAATYLASVVRQMLREIQATTFAVKGPTLLMIAEFVLVGLLWACERPAANHAFRGAVIAARLISIAVQAWLCLAFYILGMTVTAVDMAGTLPVSALLIGYLIVGVVEACRRESPRSPEF